MFEYRFELLFYIGFTQAKNCKNLKIGRKPKNYRICRCSVKKPITVL